MLLQIEDENERFRQMYKYGLVFLQKELKYALEVLRKDEFRKIDYSKLVPSFADVNTKDEDKISMIIDFLQNYWIYRLNWKEKSVHNMAFFYLTKMNDLSLMIEYLQDLENKKEAKSGIYLDLEFAFNQWCQGICAGKTPRIQEDLNRGKIIIYGILGLNEKAVDLALDTRSFDLAKKYASKSYIDQKLQKNLWLKIAKKILQNSDLNLRNKDEYSEDSVKKALELLDEPKAKEVLRIDDLLPFFPENTKVETLKDKLCDSLRSYNERIRNLKGELSDQSKNAEDLREKNRKFKNKFITIYNNYLSFWKLKLNK